MRYILFLKIGNSNTDVINQTMQNEITLVTLRPESTGISLVCESTRKIIVWTIIFFLFFCFFLHMCYSNGKSINRAGERQY